MDDSLNAEKPRKLLRWTENTGDDLEDVQDVQDSGSENNNENWRLINASSAEETSEKPGYNSADNFETTVPTKREDWYGAKMKRLKDSVEKLRKDLRDKECDYIRLKNKYNVCKRRQEQLQEDVNKQSDVKLDRDSEVEFLRLQLMEKEKELLEFRETDAACAERADKSGKVKLEGDYEADYGADNVGKWLESCFGDSILARKYLNLPKEIRRWFVYIVLGAACLSSIVAFIFNSSLLSVVAVGLWTLGLFYLWQERKELHRAFKLKHMKKVRELSLESGQLREEKRNLEVREKELEKKVSKEKEEKNEVILKLKTTNEELIKATAMNEDLVKREIKTTDELQSERVQRRRAEERLEKVTAEALLAKEEEEIEKCGVMCKKLRDNLNLEREFKEKLSRENKRLIEEIVELNMKEEKGKMQRENEKGEKQEVEVEELKKEEGMVNAEKKDGEDECKERSKPQEIKPKDTEPKIQISTESKIQRSTAECSVQTSTFEADDLKVIKQNGGVVLPHSCWFCSLKIPIEIQMALCVALLACAVFLLKIVLSSKVYFFFCLLSMLIVGVLGYYRVIMDTKVNIPEEKETGST